MRGLLALLLDRPEPVGFVLAGIGSVGSGTSFRAFLPKMIEATAHRLALHRVHVEGEVRYLRREVLQQRPQADRGTEMAARA